MVFGAGRLISGRQYFNVEVSEDAGNHCFCAV
jgi:hypothetical protein